MNKDFLTLLSVSFLILCGCMSVYNLDNQDNQDRLDRLPHEKHKGYVKFTSDFEKDSEADLSWLSHDIHKYEHGYELKIIDLSVKERSVPITERPVEHTYVVLYPVYVAVRVQGGFEKKSEYEKGKMAPYEITEEQYGGSGLPPLSWKGVCETSRKNLRIKVQENKITPVSVKAFFDFREELRLLVRNDARNITRGTGDTVKIFKGKIEVKTGSLIPLETREVEGINYSGPRIYDMEINEVYARALEAAQSLGWEIKQSEGQQNNFLMEIPGLQSDKFAFVVGVYPAKQGKIGVDLSSVTNWQRRGSYNTGLSRARIYAFYGELDKLILTDN